MTRSSYLTRFNIGLLNGARAYFFLSRHIAIYKNIEELGVTFFATQAGDYWRAFQCHIRMLDDSDWLIYLTGQNLECHLTDHDF